MPSKIGTPVKETPTTPSMQPYNLVNPSGWLSWPFPVAQLVINFILGCEGNLVWKRMNEHRVVVGLEVNVVVLGFDLRHEATRWERVGLHSDPPSAISLRACEFVLVCK